MPDDPRYDVALPGTKPAYNAEDLRRARDFRKQLDKLVARWLTGEATTKEEDDFIAAEFAKLRRERDQVAEKLAEALQGIIDIGKRDMTNPKYDGYFTSAKTALAEFGRRKANG